MIRLLLSVSLLLLVQLGSAHAVKMVGSPVIKTVGDSATVSWRTDVPCGSRLSLGTSLNKLEPRADGAVTDAHEVKLTGLTPGVTYYYQIGSARQRLAAGTLMIPRAGDTTGRRVENPPSGRTGSPEPPAPSIVGRVLDALLPQSTPKPGAPPPQVPLPPPKSTLPTLEQAPPSRITWGNPSSLQDHFERHGRDFRSRSPDDYAAQAWLFLQRARMQPLPMKLDGDALRVFDPRIGAFAAYNLDGTTKTFFRPGNATYWDRQPGRLVSPSALPPSLQARRIATP